MVGGRSSRLVILPHVIHLHQILLSQPSTLVLFVNLRGRGMPCKINTYMYIQNYIIGGSGLAIWVFEPRRGTQISNKYSQTFIKRSPSGQRKSGLIRQVTS